MQEVEWMHRQPVHLMFGRECWLECKIAAVDGEEPAVTVGFVSCEVAVKDF